MPLLLAGSTTLQATFGREQKASSHVTLTFLLTESRGFRNWYTSLVAQELIHQIWFTNWCTSSWFSLWFSHEPQIWGLCSSLTVPSTLQAVFRHFSNSPVNPLSLLSPPSSQTLLIITGRRPWLHPNTCYSKLTKSSLSWLATLFLALLFNKESVGSPFLCGDVNDLELSWWKMWIACVVGQLEIEQWLDSLWKNHLRRLYYEGGSGNSGRCPTNWSNCEGHWETQQRDPDCSAPGTFRQIGYSLLGVLEENSCLTWKTWF